jgi:hypothetical protein
LQLAFLPHLSDSVEFSLQGHFLSRASSRRLVKRASDMMLRAELPVHRMGGRTLKCQRLRGSDKLL